MEFPFTKKTKLELNSKTPKQKSNSSNTSKKRQSIDTPNTLEKTNDPKNSTKKSNSPKKKSNSSNTSKKKQSTNTPNTPPKKQTNENTPKKQNTPKKLSSNETEKSLQSPKNNNSSLLNNSFSLDIKPETVRFVDGKPVDNKEIPTMHKFINEVKMISEKRNDIPCQDFFEKHLSPFNRVFDEQVIVILGSKGKGKSRFLNILIANEDFIEENTFSSSFSQKKKSLFGKVPLPSKNSARHVTQAPIWIKYAEFFQLKFDRNEVFLNDEENILFDIKMKISNYEKSVQKIELSGPFPALKSCPKSTFIDTPGLGDFFQEKKEVFSEIFSVATCFIYLTSRIPELSDFKIFFENVYKYGNLEKVLQNMVEYSEIVGKNFPVCIFAWLDDDDDPQSPTDEDCKTILDLIDSAFDNPHLLPENTELRIHQLFFQKLKESSLVITQKCNIKELQMSIQNAMFRQDSILFRRALLSFIWLLLRKRSKRNSVNAPNISMNSIESPNLKDSLEINIDLEEFEKNKKNIRKYVLELIKEEREKQRNQFSESLTIWSKSIMQIYSFNNRELGISLFETEGRDISKNSGFWFSMVKDLKEQFQKRNQSVKEWADFFYSFSKEMKTRFDELNQKVKQGLLDYAAKLSRQQKQIGEDQQKTLVEIRKQVSSFQQPENEINLSTLTMIHADDRKIYFDLPSHLKENKPNILKTHHLSFKHIQVTNNQHDSLLIIRLSNNNNSNNNYKPEFLLYLNSDADTRISQYSNQVSKLFDHQKPYFFPLVIICEISDLLTTDFKAWEQGLEIPNTHALVFIFVINPKKENFKQKIKTDFDWIYFVDLESQDFIFEAQSTLLDYFEFPFCWRINHELFRNCSYLDIHRVRPRDCTLAFILKNFQQKIIKDYLIHCQTILKNSFQNNEKIVQPSLVYSGHFDKYWEFVHSVKQNNFEDYPFRKVVLILSQMKEDFQKLKDTQEKMNTLLDSIISHFLSLSFISTHSASSSLSFDHNLKFPDIYSDVTRYDMLHTLGLHCVFSQLTYKTKDSKLKNRTYHEIVCDIIRRGKEKNNQIGVQILTHSLKKESKKKSPSKEKKLKKGKEEKDDD